MLSFSADPQVAEKQMRAIIFYLTTFGYIDGDFDASEKSFVRAYLDVENVFPSRDLIWYTCWTDDSTHVLLGDFLAPGTNQKNALNPPDEGCGGGSFREVKVRVDGTPAGIAPGFPLVIADLNWSEDLFNNADLPIPTLEMLNAKPYRIDLSPFAADDLAAAG